MLSQRMIYTSQILTKELHTYKRKQKKKKKKKKKKKENKEKPIRESKSKYMRLLFLP